MLKASFTRSNRLTQIALAPLLALSLVACGGSKKPAAAPDNAEIDNSDEFDDGMEMMQEFGGMNEEKVTRTFKRLQPDLSQCLMDAGQDHEYLGGDIAFLVTVNSEGHVLSAHAERSNLGNYQTERCMLDILSKSRWPKPVGGHKGLARNGMGYDAPSDVRPPIDWASEEIAETLAEDDNAEVLAACGGGGPFEITAYVSANGSVLSAGVAHTVDGGEETAACLVGAVEDMKFSSPGSWRAKVSFRR